MQDEDKPSYSTAQRWSSGLNVIVGVVACLAIVVMLNYLAVRHPYRSYWSGSSTQPLSPLTHRVLESLTNQVRVIVHFDHADPLFNSVSKLVDEYRLASSKLVIETIDPDRDPAGSDAVRERFKLNEKAENNVVIFQCRDKIELVYASRLSEYGGAVTSGEKGKKPEFKRTAFKGEMLFTSAIVAATDPKPYVVRFIIDRQAATGPDRSLSPLGYDKFAQYLHDNRITVAGADLEREEIPDCDTLVIAGVHRRLSPQEIERIDRYLAKGGRALILLHHSQVTGLEAYLEKWGVAVGYDQVFDQQNSVGTPADFKLFEYGNHVSVRPLRQAANPLYFLSARSVSRKSSAPQAADTAQVEEIAFTSEGGVAQLLRDGVPRPGSRDRRGKIPVMVSVEKGGLKDVSLERGATRLIVVGDARFLANDMFDNGVNSAFGWCSVQWLLDRGRLAQGIGPRPVKEYILRMSQIQMISVRWILLAGLPGGVLFLGLLVWLRRRH